MELGEPRISTSRWVSFVQVICAINILIYFCCCGNAFHVCRTPSAIDSRLEHEPLVHVFRVHAGWQLLNRVCTAVSASYNVDLAAAVSTFNRCGIIGLAQSVKIESRKYSASQVERRST